MKFIYILISLCLGQQAFAQSFDLILTNGRIIDGSGNPWYRADIGIYKGKIAAIGKLDLNKTKRIIDVHDRIIAPGFIDIHTHIEGDEEKTPTADNFIYDGVTSVITGNCGSSEVDLKSYFKKISDLRLSVNVGSFIGQGSVRSQVMGESNAPPTAEQQKAMEQLVEKAMQDGAMGLSTGLIYVPGTYSSTQEIINLAKVAQKYGGIYTTHMRSETASIFEAIDESINIGAQAHIPVQISHLKIGRPNWYRSAQAIKMIDSARKKGLDVTCDQYPYDASSTSLSTLIPTWALAQTDSTFHERIVDSNMRRKITNEMLSDAARRGNKDFAYAIVAYCNFDTELNGKNISQINTLKGRSQSLEAEINTIIDLVDQGKIQMVFHGMREEDIETIMKYPFTMVASDGSIREFGKGMPHPRSYGSNARVLGKYVRDLQLIKLEEAIRRMTSAPALRLQLHYKGLIKDGMDADLVVFDERTVSDLSTYEHPHAFSKGFDYVIVNGFITIENGKHIGTRSGTALYGSGKSSK